MHLPTRRARTSVVALRPDGRGSVHGIHEMLEQDLRRPVISANQGSPWCCLSGVHTLVSGYGNLLRI
jgi:maleate cis-trans isomerase